MQINGIPTIGNIHNLSIGKYVSLNTNVYLQSVGGITIGDYVTISHGVTILTSGLQAQNYPDNCMTEYREHVTSPVFVGDGVWLGAGCMVMPGVKIAPKIIVAAGAVVTKDLDREGWLYAGVPAKPVKSLNKR